MQSIVVAEIILRTAAVLACALLIGCLLAGRRPGQVQWLAACFSLGVMAFVLTSFRGASAVLGIWIYPLTFMCVTKPVWFWLLAKSLFTDSFRIAPWHLAVLGLAGTGGLWQQLAYLPEARVQAGSVIEDAVSAGVNAMALLLILFGTLEAWRGLATDLVERRRRLRVLFIGAVSAYLGLAVGVQSYNGLLGVSTPRIVVLANLTLIFMAAAAIALSLRQPRPSNWLVAARRAREEAADPRDRRMLEALMDALETRCVYHDDGLTIGRLAEQLGMREQRLRRLINRELGFRNFTDLLNEYRIREACVRLRSPEEAAVPVLSIALDAGFGSVGPFNRAFKSRLGMTPTRFRERSLRPG